MSAVPSITGAGKQDEISVEIHDDEGSGTPWLVPEYLMKWHPRGLITQKELLNLVCGCDGD